MHILLSISMDVLSAAGLRAMVCRKIPDSPRWKDELSLLVPERPSNSAFDSYSAANPFSRTRESDCISCVQSGEIGSVPANARCIMPNDGSELEPLIDIDIVSSAIDNR